MHGAKNQPLSSWAPPESELVEREWRTPFLRCFSSFFFSILGELCPGLVLVSSPVAKSAYKQHKYKNKCIATGSIYTWVFNVGGVSAPLKSEFLNLIKIQGGKKANFF